MSKSKLAGILIAAAIVGMSVGDALTGYGIKGNLNLNPLVVGDGSGSDGSGSGGTVWKPPYGQACGLPYCKGNITCPYCATQNGAMGCMNIAKIDLLHGTWVWMDCTYGADLQCAHGRIRWNPDTGVPETYIVYYYDCPWWNQ